MLLNEGKTIWVMWSSEGKKKAPLRNVSPRKAGLRSLRAACLPAALSLGGQEKEPSCETGYSWDAKGLASSSDRL